MLNEFYLEKNIIEYNSILGLKSPKNTCSNPVYKIQRFYNKGVLIYYY